MQSMRHTFTLRASHLPPPINPNRSVTTNYSTDEDAEVGQNGAILPPASSPFANIQDAATRQPPLYPQHFTYPSPRVAKVFKRSHPIDANDCRFMIFTLPVVPICNGQQKQSAADLADNLLALPADDLAMLIACIKDMDEVEEVERGGGGKCYVWEMCSLYVNNGEFAAGLCRRELASSTARN